MKEWFDNNELFLYNEMNDKWYDIINKINAYSEKKPEYLKNIEIIKLLFIAIYRLENFMNYIEKNSDFVKNMLIKYNLNNNENELEIMNNGLSLIKSILIEENQK